MRLKGYLNGQEKGHSIALIGYEDWSGALDDGSHIVIILEPNGGKHKSITLGEDTGIFEYKLGGCNYYWIKSITF